MNQKNACYQIDLLRRPEEVAESVTDVRLVYVLDGRCTAIRGEAAAELNQWDFVIVNSMDSLSLRFGCEDAVVLISIDYMMLCDALGTHSVRFNTHCQRDSRQRLHQVHAQMQELIVAHVSNDGESVFQERGCFYLLLQTLLSRFLEKGIASENGERDYRVAQIIHYIRANYATNLSLNEIANQLFLSCSSASRLFKRVTGMNYNTYVKDLRLEAARQQLIQTNRSVTCIAMDNGFSTVSALKQYFQAKYGLTPAEYRERYSASGASEPDGDFLSGSRMQRDELLRLLQRNQRLQGGRQTVRPVLSCDLKEKQAWNRWRNRLLNVGSAHCLTSASVQKQVLFLAESLEIEYIRIWNLFSSEMKFLRSDGNYNFSLLDEVMDFCVDHHLRLFLDLSQRRDIPEPCREQKKGRAAGRAAFASLAHWAEALGAYLQHIRSRYQERVVGKWVFEFSFCLNENPYCGSECYSSKEAWETGWQLVKDIIPSARVAGMGLESEDTRERMDDLTSSLLDTEHRPDIFTMTVFPCTLESGRGKESTEQERENREDPKELLTGRITAVKQMLNREQYEGELWVTDWGRGKTRQNYVQDSCLWGVFLLDQYLRCREKADSLGLFYATDLMDHGFASEGFLSGSAGVLSRDGICKPSFFVSSFISRLGRYFLSQSENCIVTAESDHEIRVLCCHNKGLKGRGLFCAESVSDPDTAAHLFSEADPLSMELCIQTEAEKGCCSVRQEVLNERSGSVLNKWVNYGCPNQLSRSDLQYLRGISTPEIMMEKVPFTDGKLCLKLKMEPNEIRFITIVRE